MAALLTWNNAGPQVQTSTSVGDCFTDLKNLIDSVLANALYKWQVSSSNLAGTPYYVTLKPKSGAAGRILIVCWTGAPAGNNVAILDTTPTSNQLHICYFPNGNVDTPSALTAASGTIMGNDTGAVKCTPIGTLSTLYASGYRWSYLDTDEQCLFFTQQSGVHTTYGGCAGMCLVDSADVAYAGTIGAGATALQNMAGGTPTAPWTPITALAGSTTGCIRTNYGGPNRQLALAFAPVGTFNNQAPGAQDPTIESSTGRAYFFAIPLIPAGATPAVRDGAPLKMRQIAFGPQVQSAWQVFNTTGPVVAARAAQSFPTTGVNLWCTNFRV